MAVTLATKPRPRAQERGNALFIVVMVMTLLSAVGMYAMRAASLAAQASGYNRQGVQTAFIAEFAGRSVAAELVGKEQHYFQYISSGADDCRGNRELAALTEPNRPPCYKLDAGEIWERVNGEFTGNVGTDSVPTLFGELSREGLTASFIVEMTDLARAGAPITGEDVAADTFKHMQVLLTATGQVRPASAGGGNDNACNQALSATSSLSNLRARVTFGPIY